MVEFPAVMAEALAVKDVARGAAKTVTVRVLDAEVPSDFVTVSV